MFVILALCAPMDCWRFPLGSTMKSPGLKLVLAIQFWALVTHLWVCFPSPAYTMFPSLTKPVRPAAGSFVQRMVLVEGWVTSRTVPSPGAGLPVNPHAKQRPVLEVEPETIKSTVAYALPGSAAAVIAS